MIKTNPLRDFQRESPSCYCEKCRQEVYGGETMYLWEGQWMCPECFRIALNLEPLDQLALELGIEAKAV